MNLWEVLLNSQICIHAACEGKDGTLSNSAVISLAVPSSKLQREEAEEMKGALPAPFSHLFPGADHALIFSRAFH